MENSSSDELRKLPGVDTMLAMPAARALIALYGLALTTYAVRQAIGRVRDAVSAGKPAASSDELVKLTEGIVQAIAEPSLKPVINATGVVLHTNLGRAPLGRRVLDEIAPIVTGYSNLEFDLKSGKRGERGSHCVELIRYLTGAEDALVVNNNAAALVLLLSTFAKGKEVVVSRGELIEIGGAFRIPEIMRASGSRMVEVGTTNRTRAADYEEAITSKTAVLFKAHKSNFSMSGFVEEADVDQLARLARDRGLVSVYDIGSGLLRRPRGLGIDTEPDVAAALKSGIDLVCFSGDKLLGGPQAGMIVGRAELIRKLSKAPLMRALRAGKLTIAALSASLRTYLDDESLIKDNPAFAMLSSTPRILQERAERLRGFLTNAGIDSEIVDSTGQVGGGTLPDHAIVTKAVSLIAPPAFAKRPDKFAEKVHRELMRYEHPVVGILREGRLLFDTLTIQDREIDSVATAIIEIVTA